MLKPVKKVKKVKKAPKDFFATSNSQKEAFSLNQKEKDRLKKAVSLVGASLALGVVAKFGGLKYATGLLKKAKLGKTLAGFNTGAKGIGVPKIAGYTSGASAAGKFTKLRSLTFESAKFDVIKSGVDKVKKAAKLDLIPVVGSKTIAGIIKPFKNINSWW